MQASGAAAAPRGAPNGANANSARTNGRMRTSVTNGGFNLEPPASKTHRYIKGTTIEKPVDEGSPLLSMMLHPMNILLICLPLGLAAFYLEWGEQYVFWFNFCAMVPLAKILGDATEELAAALKNDMVAGLLNATFGNAVEMVITVKTLRAGLYDVVKATLLGSVLSNTLLVLGMSCFLGGLVTLSGNNDNKAAQYTSLPAAREDDSMSEPRRNVAAGDRVRSTTSQAPTDLTEESSAEFYQTFDMSEKVQNFSTLGALVNVSMLLISCTSFSLVTVFGMTCRGSTVSFEDEILLPVSRIASIVILMAYLAYTFFQLVTHKEAMGGQEDDGGGDGAEGTHMSAWLACAILFGVTLLVSVCSEMLVDAIGGVTEKAHISKHFIGVVLLPIVGNACEHAAAVRFAMQDKLGLAVSIAVGSSTQIALFVVPFSVLAGWYMDGPMDLAFGALSTSVITFSVIVVLAMVVDGQSNWLQGYLLCSVYAIIAVMYWYLPDDLRDNAT